MKAITLLAFFASSCAVAGTVDDGMFLLGQDSIRLQREIKDLHVSVLTSFTLTISDFEAECLAASAATAKSSGMTEFLIGVSSKALIITVSPSNPNLRARFAPITAELSRRILAGQLYEGLLGAAQSLEHLKVATVESHLEWLAKVQPDGQRQAWWDIPLWEVWGATAAWLALVYASFRGLHFSGPGGMASHPFSPPQQSGTWTPGGGSVLKAKPAPKPPEPLPPTIRRMKAQLPGSEVVFPNVVPPLGGISLMGNAGGGGRGILAKPRNPQLAPGFREWYDPETNTMIIMGPSGQRSVIGMDQYAEFGRRLQGDILLGQQITTP